MSHSGRAALLVLIGAMLLVACTGGQFVCEDPWGCVSYGPDDPIHIATVLVISGADESLGLDSQRGVEIAILDQGQLLGHQIRHTAADGQCSAAGGEAAASTVVTDPTIVSVVGHSCSSSCRPAAPIYAEAGVVVISPSCTAPSLTLTERGATFFRTCHNDSVQGKFAAEFFFDQLGLRSAATIHDGSPYAEQLARVFAESFSAKGGTITAEESIEVGATDAGPLLTAIAQGEPELIYYPIFIAEGALITQQAKETPGLENTILAGADGMISPDFIQRAGASSEGMYFTGPDLSFDNERYDHLLSVYGREYGSSPPAVFHAHAYDATNLLFAAIEKAAVREPDGTLHIGRQALRDAVAATQNLVGATGTLTCDANGDCSDPRITVRQIQGSDYVVVWTP